MDASWLIFLCASFLFVLAGAVTAWLLCKPYRKGKTKIRPLYSAIGGVFLGGLVLLLPVHWAGSVQDIFGVVKTGALSLIGAVELFAGGDYKTVAEGVKICNETLESMYLAWAVALHGIAPILTVSYLATMLKNFMASLRYNRAKDKATYVFSQLNEKSLALAQDIFDEAEDTNRIVFTGLQDDWEKGAEQWLPDLRKMNAICFKKGLDTLDLLKKAGMRDLSFFLISEDRQENLRLAKKLIPEYENRQANTRIYVFAESLESELVLTAITPAKSRFLQVKRIREARNLVNYLLQSRPGRVFGTAVPQESGLQHIGAVIVGMGDHGTEMLKALAWYCQMPGYSVTIDAFDRDKLALEKFVAAAPELMSPQYNGVTRKGEAAYTIRIHPGVDATSADFFRQVKEIENVSYIFVNLGSDELNIATGIELWRQAARKQEDPAVDVLVYDGGFKDVLATYESKERKFKDDNYAGVEVVGDLQTAYSNRVILNTELEKRVTEINRRYNEVGDYQYSINNEYSYYSTAACAIHRYAKEFCGVTGTPELEHIRWNAYMRAEGFQWSGSTDPKSRLHIAKTHQDLVPFGKLLDEEIKKDEALVGSGGTKK